MQRRFKTIATFLILILICIGVGHSYFLTFKANHDKLNDYILVIKEQEANINNLEKTYNQKEFQRIKNEIIYLNQEILWIFSTNNISPKEIVIERKNIINSIFVDKEKSLNSDKEEERTLNTNFVKLNSNSSKIKTILVADFKKNAFNLFINLISVMLILFLCGLAMFMQSLKLNKKIDSTLNKLNSEENLLALAEADNKIFWICKPQLTEFIYISDSYEKVWGRRCNALFDNPKLFLAAILKEDRETLEKILFNPEAYKDFEVKFRIFTPLGDLKYLHGNGKVTRDENEKIEYISCVVKDITNEELKKEGSNLLTSALKTAKIPLLLTDFDGVIKFWNNKLSDYLGYTEDKVINKNFKNFISADQQYDFFQSLNLTSQNDSAVSINVKLITSSKDLKDYNLLISSIKNEANKIIAISIYLAENKSINYSPKETNIYTDIPVPKVFTKDLTNNDYINPEKFKKNSFIKSSKTEVGYLETTSIEEKKNSDKANIIDKGKNDFFDYKWD